MYEARLEDITPELARRSGFASVVDALKTAKHGAGERVFVIDFHYDGKEGARSKPTTGVISTEELAELVQRLAAMDRRSRVGAWTQATLRAIEARPGVLAAKLARSLGAPARRVQARRSQAQESRPHLEPRDRLSADAEGRSAAGAPLGGSHVGGALRVCAAIAAASSRCGSTGLVR